MNKTMTILSSFLFLSALTESKPRYKHGHRYERQRFQYSEEQNEYDSSSSRMGPRPAVNSKVGQHFGYDDLDSEEVTRNLPYPRPFQPNLEESNRDSFGSYGSGGNGRTNNQRAFRPNLEEAHGRNKEPYYDFERNNRRSYEMGDFGNGHHNENTFNIHKKIIYID